MSNNARRLLWVVGFLVVVTIVASVWLFSGRSESADLSKEPLRVGYQTSPAMALVMIADNERFFEEAGVNVSLQEFTAGKLALQAFLGGSLDVAIAGDVPIGLAVLQGQRLVAFAEVIRDSTDEMRMVVRAPEGCNRSSPASYFLDGPPRSIGTSFGGGPEYFTVTFLRSAGVPLNRVRLVSQAPPEMAASLVAGNVDGIAIFDPAATSAERQLASAGCTFADPRSYRQHYIAVARPDDVHASDPRLQGFVRALQMAERFAAANPEAAMAIVQRRTSIDRETLTALWPKLQFGVTLDGGLPRLWMAQEDYHRTKADARFPEQSPNYVEVLDDRFVR